MSKIMEIKDLNFQYGTTTIFHHFHLSLEEGSYISIAGNNRSGKTTLIKLIGGLLPSKDTITINYSYVDSNRIKDHTKDLGIVFGNLSTPFLFEDVYKEMAFSLENLNYSIEEIEHRILEVAHLFKINKLLEKKTSDLTNAEKQILLLAIAILHYPKILLLDHPFSMMDSKTKQFIKKVLKDYQKKNHTTILLTTTNLEDTLDTDYLYILNQGKIVVEGKPLVVLKEDTLLNRLGFSLPFMVDLSYKLEFYELLKETELDMDRMVNTLWK